MAQDRTSTTVWGGDAQTGSGQVTGDTGALGEQKVTLSNRINQSEGLTSPEEFLAAAHSSCLAMNLAATLAKNGTPAESVTVSSKVGVGPKDGGGLEVTHAHVDIRGKVPGLTEEQFQELATTAEETCPIANVIRGNVVSDVTITFEG